MPPTRTIPPAKAVKTERTHEENQERAYIAASRRSDRSLEARVESARRASEIHKRRTGRSLRVTEQDVINEEMYEEEDDDLPMQYRRLTAHLQTNSADFNRRLAAYLTSSVAMRSAVDQMNGNPGAQQYPMNAPQYAQPRPNMFQSPLLPQQSPQMTQSPTMMNSYRHAPYPSPHHPGFRQAHGRAYSAATLPTKMHTPPIPVPASLDHRRMSTPGTIPPPLETAAIKADPEYLRQTQSAQTPHSMTNPYWQDTSPFTTSLPPESQQMLAGAPGLDPHDPFSASLMQGSEQYVNHPYYPWGQQESKFGPYHAMSATLAPSALSNQTDSLAVTPSSNTATSYESRASHSMEPYGANHMHLNIKEGNSPYSLPSGQVTPGESFWSSFVQDSSWNDDGGVTIS